MFKKGPSEKEKILEKLTEKEIKDQLYGFNAKPHQAVSEGVVVKKPLSPEPRPKEQKIKKESNVLKNPYLLIQIALLAVFLILIWFSLRQIIKAVSNTRKPSVSEQQNLKQKTTQSQKAKLRRK